MPIAATTEVRVDSPPSHQAPLTNHITSHRSQPDQTIPTLTLPKSRNQPLMIPPRDLRDQSVSTRDQLHQPLRDHRDLRGHRDLLHAQVMEIATEEDSVIEASATATKASQELTADLLFAQTTVTEEEDAPTEDASVFKDTRVPTVEQLLHLHGILLSQDKAHRLRNQNQLQASGAGGNHI